MATASFTEIPLSARCWKARRPDSGTSPGKLTRLTLQSRFEPVVYGDFLMRELQANHDQHEKRAKMN